MSAGLGFIFHLFTRYSWLIISLSNNVWMLSRRWCCEEAVINQRLQSGVEDDLDLNTQSWASFLNIDWSGHAGGWGNIPSNSQLEPHWLQSWSRPWLSMRECVLWRCVTSRAYWCDTSNTEHCLTFLTRWSSLSSVWLLSENVSWHMVSLLYSQPITISSSVS